MARRAFAHIYLVHQLCPFINHDALQTVTQIHPGHHTMGLLQYTLHLAALEDHLEATTDSTYSGTSSNRCLSVCPLVTTAVQAALAASWFLIEFKILIIIYKALYGMGLRYLRVHLSPAVSACPKRSSRVGALQVPSLNIAILWNLESMAFVLQPPSCRRVSPQRIRIAIVLST